MHCEFISWILLSESSFIPLISKFLGDRIDGKRAQLNVQCTYQVLRVCSFLRLYLFIFRERGREGEREGEKHQCTGEMSVSCLWYVPHPGAEHTTQARALTGS